MDKEKNGFKLSPNTALYIKGTAIGILVTIGFILLFSAVMLLLDLGYRFAAPFATISVAAGSFSAAFITAKGIAKKGYLVGIIIGIIVFSLITLIALAINKSGITGNTLFHFIIITLASIIGGIVGVNYKKNKKYI